MIGPSQRFHARDRDGAIRLLKLTSVTVAKLATMVLSETRGLELSWVVREGIGFSRDSCMKHTRPNFRLDTLSRTRASQDVDWHRQG